MDFHALSIDPGGTTGFCLVRQHVEDKVLHITPFQLKLTPKEFLHTLKAYLNPGLASEMEFVICESFEYRQRARAGLDLTPAHLIGVLMAFVGDSDRLYFQTAAQGKGHFSDDKLKQLDVYIPARPHAMDATRHFLQWYKFGPGYRYFIEGVELKLHGSS